MSETKGMTTEQWMQIIKAELDGKLPKNQLEATLASIRKKAISGPSPDIGLSVKEQFNQLKEAHDARFRRIFRREPKVETPDEYTALDFLRSVYAPQNGLQRLDTQELSKDHADMFSLLSDYRKAQNKRKGSPTYESMEDMLRSEWLSPEERVFANKTDPLSGKPAKFEDKTRPTYAEKAERLNGYNDAFYMKYRRMPKHKEKYSPLHFLTDIWGDMMASGTLTGKLLKDKDPKLYEAINNSLAYRNSRKGVERISLGDILSGALFEEVVPSSEEEPERIVSDILRSGGIDPAKIQRH